MNNDPKKRDNIRRAKEHFDARQKAKIKGETERNNTSRSPQEQAKVLDARLGKGKGAKKERRKIERKISQTK